MGIFSKRHDPIAERERAVAEQLAEVRAQIKRAESSASPVSATPRLRSTAQIEGRKLSTTAPTVRVTEPPRRLPAVEAGVTQAHFNQLGVRKYDLASALRRIVNQLRGGPARKSQVVTLLAAGSISGLRPLRYEQRVARNRFIGLFVFLLLVLFGLFVFFMQNH